MRLLLGTTNRGKLRELYALLDGLPGLVLLEPDDVGGLPTVIEDGATFEANARKKALAIARARDVATLSDDSGLEVDALGGRPGVRSARFALDQASGNATDADNNRALVQALANVPAERRSARYRAVIAFCDPGQDATAPHLHVEEASCEGHLQLEPAGQGGFGYDPHFVPEGHNCTMSELSLDTKNRISHRARAVRAMRSYLEAYLRGNAANPR
jgi:XTP/dITP diphosphohydrolase